MIKEMCERLARCLEKQDVQMNVVVSMNGLDHLLE